MPFKSQDDNKHSFTVATDETQFRLDQDVQSYKDYAEKSREKDKYMEGSRKTTYRPFCIIPDIVAIDILTRYGIDIHAPEFMHDQAQKFRFANIMRTEFPELLTSAAANLTNTGGGSGVIIT